MCRELNFTTFLHKKLTREVNSLIIYCKYREKGCNWKGERRQLKAHLNPERTTQATAGSTPQKACKYALVVCSYCGDRFQRRKIREHEVDVCPKRPVEAKLETFKRMTEKENHQLRQELHSIRESHKMEVRMIKRAHEQAFSQIHQQLSQMYQRKLDEVKASYEKVISEQKRIYQQQKAHTAPLTLTPFYFVIVNLDHYQVNNYMFNSEPFYSHPGGYKMIMTIYPNGVGESRDTHVSVYVGILRGEFDDQLRWPFSGVVIVEAYNRTLDQWSNRTEISLNPLKCDLRVVSKRVNVLVDGKKGCQNFLPLAEFKNDYVKSLNVARFRVLYVKVYS
jgi:TNF receptor-associated factor 4